MLLFIYSITHLIFLLCFYKKSEWVIKFDGLFADRKVHVIHISHVIMADVLELSSSLI